MMDRIDPKDRSDDLTRCDLEHVWHPFSPMSAYRAERPPMIVAGEGFELIDADGRRYLDGHSSLWCNIHGHRVPEIDAAIRDQLDRIAHSTLLGLASEPSSELAYELVQRAPAGLTKVFYSDDGSTAVEAAIKLAYQYHRQKPGGGTGRTQLVRLEAAYHGDTLGAVSAGGIALFHQQYQPLLFETLWAPSPASSHPDAAERDREQEAAWRAMDELLVTRAGEIFAVIVEPRVQAAAGILVHPPGYLRKLRELTASLGILLIVDEVATAFGRTGSLWACAAEDVSPDLMCLSKGLSGGYLPLAATLATDAIYDAFLGDPWEGRTFYHGHTFTGNPLACAAALASLRRIETHRVLDNVRSTCEALSKELEALNDHPHVGDVRQCGLMAGIELVERRDDRSPFDPRRRMGHRVTLACRERGVILRNIGDVVVLMPAPAMPPDHVEQLARTAIAAIQDVVRE